MDVKCSRICILFELDDAIKSVPVVNARTSNMEAKCYCLFSHCTYFKSDGVFLVKLVYVLSSPKLCEKTTLHSEAPFNV